MRAREARAQDQLDVTTLSLQWTKLVSTWSAGWDLPGDSRAHWLLTVGCPKRKHKDGQVYTQGALMAFLSCGWSLSKTHLFVESFYRVESWGTGEASKQ